MKVMGPRTTGQLSPNPSNQIAQSSMGKQGITVEQTRASIGHRRRNRPCQSGPTSWVWRRRGSIGMPPSTHGLA